MCYNVNERMDLLMRVRASKERERERGKRGKVKQTEIERQKEPPLLCPLHRFPAEGTAQIKGGPTSKI